VEEKSLAYSILVLEKGGRTLFSKVMDKKKRRLYPCLTARAVGKHKQVVAKRRKGVQDERKKKIAEDVSSYLGI